MSEKPISPLRQRMLEDMNVRRFTPDTQREYVRAVKRLAAFLGRSPDTATAEERRAAHQHRDGAVGVLAGEVGGGDQPAHEPARRTRCWRACRSPPPPRWSNAFPTIVEKPVAWHTKRPSSP